MNRRNRLSRTLTIGALLSAVVLGGCSGEEAAPGGGEPTAGGGDGGASKPEPLRSPLTGLKVKGKAPDHPVLVTKVDNTSSSAPQQGLAEADMLVEEKVEGGVTRLAAFYWSDLPSQVGPVRSMRASDIGIVGPANGTIVTSGGAPVTNKRVTQAGIPFRGEGTKGVFRDNSRSAPYNLFADLGEVAAATDGPRKAPAYFDFGTSEDLPRGPRATTINANFGSRVSTWAFRDGAYVNTNAYTTEDQDFEADTVLALRVPVGDAGYTDPAGNAVPETTFAGKGEALLFHDGRVVKGTWSKKGLDGHLRLTAKGKRVTVPTGNTMLALVPANGGNLSYD